MDARRTLNSMDNVCRILATSTPTRVIEALEVCNVLMKDRDPLARLLTLLTFNDDVVERDRPKDRTDRRSTRTLRVRRLPITIIRT